MWKRLICLVSLVVVLNAAGTVSADLVAHWRFDEGSGTVANDSSGNNNHGTVMGGAQWIAGGKLGGALDFDGHLLGYYREHIAKLIIKDTHQIFGAFHKGVVAITIAG